MFCPGYHRTCGQEVGGVEGLLQYEEKLRQTNRKKKVNKVAKYEASDEGKAERALHAATPAREQAFSASLAKHGLQHEHGFQPYKDYLCRAVGDPDEIAVQAAHLTWLFNNTDVRTRMERLSTYKLPLCMHMAE